MWQRKAQKGTGYDWRHVWWIVTLAQSAKLRFSLRRKHASKEIKIYKLWISNEAVKYLCSRWTDVGHHFQNTVAALAESSAYSCWANRTVFKCRDRLTLFVITPTKCWWRKVALPNLQTPKKGALYPKQRSQEPNGLMCVWFNKLINFNLT